MPTYDCNFISLKGAYYNGNGEIEILLGKIKFQKAAISMMKAVNT